MMMMMMNKKVKDYREGWNDYYVLGMDGKERCHFVNTVEIYWQTRKKISLLISCNVPNDPTLVVGEEKEKDKGEEKKEKNGEQSLSLIHI